MTGMPSVVTYVDGVAVSDYRDIDGDAVGGDSDIDGYAAGGDIR